MRRASSAIIAIPALASDKVRAIVAYERRPDTTLRDFRRNHMWRGLDRLVK